MVAKFVCFNESCFYASYVSASLEEKNILANDSKHTSTSWSQLA